MTYGGTQPFNPRSPFCAQQYLPTGPIVFLNVDCRKPTIDLPTWPTLPPPFTDVAEQCGL